MFNLQKDLLVLWGCLVDYKIEESLATKLFYEIILMKTSYEIRNEASWIWNTLKLRV
jgi:hypothetical protein